MPGLSRSTNSAKPGSFADCSASAAARSKVLAKYTLSGGNWVNAKRAPPPGPGMKEVALRVGSDPSPGISASQSVDQIKAVSNPGVYSNMSVLGTVSDGTKSACPCSSILVTILLTRMRPSLSKVSEVNSPWAYGCNFAECCVIQSELQKIRRANNRRRQR